jgi:hypothetical protein
MLTLPAIETVDDDALEAMISRAWREAVRCTADFNAGANGPLVEMLAASADSAIAYHQHLRDEWQRRRHA